MVVEKLGATLPEVEAVLAVLQTLEPPGVCARNLTECLAIQLKERDRFDPAMQALVGRLDLLAKHDLPALRRICGVSDDDLTDMIASPDQVGDVRTRHSTIARSIAAIAAGRKHRASVLGAHTRHPGAGEGDGARVSRRATGANQPIATRQRRFSAR